MIKFRRLLAGMAIGILSIVTAGCHGVKKGNEFKVPEKFDVNKNYEVVFWAKNDTNKNQSMVYEKAAKDFEKMYPNIKVTIKMYTDYNKIYNDVITNITTDTTPNVCISYPDNIATYMTGENTVVKLDDLITNEKYGLGGSEVRFDSVKLSEIIPQYMEECIINTGYYAIPYVRSTEACYINKDYVQKLGYDIPEVLTWDYIFEVSNAAMKKDAEGNFLVNGQKVLIPFIYKSTDNMTIQYLFQKNLDYTTATGDILLFNENTREFLDMVKNYAENGSFSTFKISGYPANFLNAGQCIFAVDSTAGSTWMGSEAPLSDIAEDKIVKFETVVKMPPQADIDNPKIISQGPSICIFNKKDSQEVLASWLFAQYLLSNDVQINYSKTEGYVPVTSKARNSSEYRDYLNGVGEDLEHYKVKIDAVNMLLENNQYTFVTPVFNGSASVRMASEALIENVVKSSRRKETIDDAYYEKIYKEIVALYRLDQIEGNRGKVNLGPMPLMSKLLIASLILVWLIIFCTFINNKLKNK